MVLKSYPYSIYYCILFHSFLGYVTHQGLNHTAEHLCDVIIDKRFEGNLGQYPGGRKLTARGKYMGPCLK
jgi:hypothetical protein